MSVNGDGADQELIVLFYKYFRIASPPRFADVERKVCESLGLVGRLLVSEEGVNGTLSGTRESLLEFTTRRSRASEDDWRVRVDWKFSDWPSADEERRRPFPDLVVKCVREIVGWALPTDFMSTQVGGTHLSPQQFHDKLAKFLADQEEAEQSGENEKHERDWVLFDVRNAFEHSVGHFDGAEVRDSVRTTAEYRAYLEEALTSRNLREKQVMMYCTGGVRCEKASAYLRSRGVANVFQLKGGIHRYLEEFPDGGLFRGKNFVFDGRVTQEASEIEGGSGKEEGGGRVEDRRDDEAAREIVGRCRECDCPHDRLSGGRICSVCHALLLICDACHDNGRVEHYCSAHSELRGAYCNFLERFSEEELLQQEQRLQDLLDRYAVGRRDKNRRATLRKQVERIRQRVEDLRGGVLPTPEGEWLPRCHICREESCDGNCWGIWKA